MKLKYYYFVLLSFALTLVACDDDPVLLKDPVSALSNDCIKRSLPVAPNIVGNEIEFAYAMAIPNELGKLSSAQVVSSIAGATGTYFDPNSYYTNSSGQDIPVKVCSDSQTNGTTTVIDFTVDTCAATLRYYYIIPEEARGKDVQFSFSVKASNGQVAEYKLGPYKISKMDMAKNLSVTNDKCYLSFLNERPCIFIQKQICRLTLRWLRKLISCMRIVKNRICHMPSILLLLQKNIWVEQNSLPVLSIIPR